MADMYNCEINISIETYENPSYKRAYLEPYMRIKHKRNTI